MTQHYQIGDVRVSRIEELMGPMFDPVRFFSVIRSDAP